MGSIWIETVKRPHFDSLQHDIKTDVLIVGGGIAGVLCAYMLKQNGVECALVEADRICNGTTADTTAKLTLQHGLVYDKLINKYGYDAAWQYFHAQRLALYKYRVLCEKFDCDFEESPAFVYSRTDGKSLEREAVALEKLGCPVSFSNHSELPFKVVGAVGIDRQAHFHPLKFAFEAVRGLNVYEKTKVLEFKPHEAVTDKGRIAFKKLIITTHFPIINKHGSFFLKMYQHRSYVTALKNTPEINGMYVDEDMKGLSFRNYKGILLLGGGGHRTGKQGGNWRELEGFSKRYYPKAEAVARWAAQDCMTLDGIPYIGQYSRRTPDIYVATGFNKWGMTSSMVAAMILTDTVLGKNNEYASVFSPSRSIVHPQLAVNLAESLMGLLTPTVPRCPHMGCALKYNKQERSWDCSCHGSRFTESGELINNPATDDKKNLPQ